MVEPRPPKQTVKFVDEYCLWYKKLFSDVRNFEAFKYLHIGCISELKRKSLPEIAKIVGRDNFVLFNLIYPWLTVFPIPQLSSGFSKLQAIVYRLTSPILIFLTHLNSIFPLPKVTQQG
jgi:hypothetical protein